MEQLGGKATPAVGFAMGIERLVLLLEACDVVQHINHQPDVYVVSDDPLQGLLLSESARNQLPHLRVQCHCGGGKFKKQMKKANDSGARYAFILGRSEIENNQVTIKDLRSDKEQVVIAQDQLETYFAENLNSQE